MGSAMNYIIDKKGIKDGQIYICAEMSALPGVKHVAEWIANDMEAVFGEKPAICGSECGGTPIICATVGYSDIADRLHDEGVVCLDDIKGKNECFIFRPIHVTMQSCEDTTALLILGSDKRGTIYGMLHLSEILGVSPFTDWLDVKPLPKESFAIDESDAMVSKEPSVRYRGFFINDEWPAFGNWCNKRFGGFNAKCYEHVFELLLRLKGNYMWPAMWSAIFPDDGPGLANAELADKLGVVMGMSHHEPCLRQGEEYKYLRGPESIYGDAWDFRKNKEGITRFWEDGLKRGGHLENVITVGMRGEFDSTVLGKEATLGDNIELIRDVLKTQNDLIRKYVNPDLTKVPRMLALYKEVEAFYYGDEQYKGLQGDPELDGVTLMLCDDNFGNLRTVPPEDERIRNGGWGMYYHMDYHGWPISYEWANSSCLSKIWEQMSAAYDFGIRELWIVNVGDIFSTEYPLSYFLNLAYDFEKWGTSDIASYEKYCDAFVRTQFPDFSQTDLEDTKKLLTGYTRIASNRRPEAANVGVYDPVWYDESDELVSKCNEYMMTAQRLYDSRSELSSYPFFELVYYPLMANLNVQKMWLYTGRNHFLASIGASDAAAEYATKTDNCLDFDKKLVDKLHTIHDGMWYGMGMSQHIGFNYWNEEECRYPILHSVRRPDKPRIVAHITGTDRHTEGGDWTAMNMILDTFLRPDGKKGLIRLYSIGEGDAAFEATTDSGNVVLSRTSGTLAAGAVADIEVTLRDRDAAFKAAQGAAFMEYNILIKTPSGKIRVRIPVNTRDYGAVKPGTYVWCGVYGDKCFCEHYDVRTAERCIPNGYISIEAGHFTRKTDTEAGTFKEMKEYGRTLSGMKAFPVTTTYTPGKDAPCLEYDVYMESAGTYCVDAYVTPANPPYKNNLLRFGISATVYGATKDDIILTDTVARNFGVGDDNHAWKQGVLDNIHVCTSEISLAAGNNTIRIYACDPGFVLQKLVIYMKDMAPAGSYLGPGETYRTV